jgi:hypothetical protein
METLDNLEACLHKKFGLTKVGNLNSGSCGGIYAPVEKIYVANLRIQNGYRTRGPKFGIEFDYLAEFDLQDPLVSLDALQISNNVVPEYLDPKFRKDGQRWLRAPCRKTTWHLLLDYPKDAREYRIIDDIVEVVRQNQQVFKKAQESFLKKQQSYETMDSVRKFGS